MQYSIVNCSQRAALTSPELILGVAPFDHRYMFLSHPATNLGNKLFSVFMTLFVCLFHM